MAKSVEEVKTLLVIDQSPLNNWYKVFANTHTWTLASRTRTLANMHTHMHLITFIFRFSKETKISELSKQVPVSNMSQ